MAATRFDLIGLSYRAQAIRMLIYRFGGKELFSDIMAILWYRYNWSEMDMILICLALAPLAPSDAEYNFGGEPTGAAGRLHFCPPSGQFRICIGNVNQKRVHRYRFCSEFEWMNFNLPVKWGSKLIFRYSTIGISWKSCWRKNKMPAKAEEKQRTANTFAFNYFVWKKQKQNKCSPEYNLAESFSAPAQRSDRNGIKGDSVLHTWFFESHSHLLALRSARRWNSEIECNECWNEDTIFFAAQRRQVSTWLLRFSSLGKRIQCQIDRNRFASVYLLTSCHSFARTLSLPL